MNRLSKKIEVSELSPLMFHYGFKVFSKRDKRFNLNIINIRSRETKAGKFDDVQIVFWFYKGKLEYRKYDVTVDPGVPYLLKPLNKKGAAIVVPGQYRGVWRLGKHRGKYDALVQVQPIEVYRDNDRDDHLKSIPLNYVNIHPELGYSIDRGLFGINCHRASNYSLAERVGYYSAGCVVHQDPKGYEQFIKICKFAAINWNNSFTATWITEIDYDKYINSLTIK